MKRVERKHEYKLDTGSRMCVISARSILVAKRFAREEYGRGEVRSVTHATPKDVEWYRAMGGRIDAVE